MTNKIIGVIAAHPDDEVLGCGGTIAKHTNNGDIVHILIMAEGATSRSEIYNREKQAKELNRLAKSAEKASKTLGAKSLTLLDFPDNRMDSVDRLDVIKEIEKFILVNSPEIIYTHSASDINIDHQIVHDSVITACRSKPGNSLKSILCFEILSSTEWQTPDSQRYFLPNWFEEISSTLKIKLKALSCYHQEMCYWPHSRSYKAVEVLASWRGAIVGVDAAEAFVLSRMIQKEN